MPLFRTPKDRGLAVAYVAGVWLALPSVTAITILVNQQRRIYSAQADGVGFAILDALVSGALALPYFLILLVAACKGYAGSAPLLGVDWDARGILSWVLIAPGVYLIARRALPWLDINHAPIVLVHLAAIYALLMLRGMIGARPRARSGMTRAAD